MKKSLVWVVVVRFGQGRSAIDRILHTKVRLGENAIAWAKAHNPGGGYDWDNAEVLKPKR